MKYPLVNHKDKSIIVVATICLSLLVILPLLVESRISARHSYYVELLHAHECFNELCAADFDGDGHVDLLFANYFADGSRILDAHSTHTPQMQDSMSRAYNGGSKHFLLWKRADGGDSPRVAFAEQKDVLEGSAQSGWTLALAACDLDGDLLPEMYIANDFGPDVLLHNLSVPGHLRFQRLFGKRTMMTPASTAQAPVNCQNVCVQFDRWCVL